MGSAYSKFNKQGKTVLPELAIIRLPKIKKRRKIIYIAPTKALCNERAQDWQKRNSELLGLLVTNSLRC
jgi:ATP-dependent DNA helicase HFM1/MER3